ncbi:MAG: DUF2085 domain-containing protein [candidate division Zixibacteria bacterium]|nr:DUF2085 domain-containing protein [candidate division Zixibacteria bacterium]
MADRYSEVITQYSQTIGNSLAAFLFKHWLDLINLFLLMVISGSLLAPYLASFGHSSESRAIYAIYHIACHEKESRCLFLLGHKMSLCARCFSIYLSLFILGFFWNIFTHRRKGILPVNFKVAFLLVIPLILDVTSQALGLRESTNVLRIFTGFCLSLSIVLYLYPKLKMEIEELDSISKRTLSIERQEEIKLPYTGTQNQEEI